MNPAEKKHRELTELRIQAYVRLFGGGPQTIFSSLRFAGADDDTCPIDVLVFPLDPEVPVVAAVTSGMSDERLVDPERPERWRRRELIQYFPACSEPHARRLHDMAWAPRLDGFVIDSHFAMSWDFPALAGTPWKNALFLEPIVRQHRDFRFAIKGDDVSFLWHIPLSDDEYRFVLANGVNALLDRMAEVQLPWIFDEMNRPPLLQD